MATNEIKADTKVSTEKSLHDALRSFLTDIHREHGVAVDSVSARWLYMMDGSARLLDLELQTTTRD